MRHETLSARPEWTCPTRVTARGKEGVQGREGIGEDGVSSGKRMRQRELLGVTRQRKEQSRKVYEDLSLKRLF